jgi:MFS family permease
LSTPIDAEAGLDSRPIWRNSDFMLLWIAQAISQTAQNALWYGILVLVQNKSQSSTHLSVAIMTLIVPSVLFGVAAGVFVDRWDKRWVLIGSNALRGVITLGDLLALVYAVNFLFSTISQFFAPAEAAMIPGIVAKRRLLEANSLFHLTFTGSQLAGLVLVGPLIVNIGGADALFALSAVLIGFCALLCWPLPSHRGAEDSEQAQTMAAFWQDVREVWAFIRQDAVVRWAIGVWTLGAILGIVVAMLAPGFAVNVLNIRAEDSVLVLSPAGVGMFAGTLVFSRFGHRFNKYRLVNAGLIVVSTAIFALGIVGPAWRRFVGPVVPDGVELQHLGLLIWVVMAMALVAGFGFVSMIVPSQTIIQERAPVSIRGRVFSIQFMLSNVLSIVPLVFLGGLADLIGVARTLIVLGVALFVITYASIMISRAAGRQEVHPESGS